MSQRQGSGTYRAWGLERKGLEKHFGDENWNSMAFVEGFGVYLLDAARDMKE